jgi:hypothetical protein
MKYSLRSLMIAKVFQLGAIAALAGCYLYLMVSWGASARYAIPYAWAYSILAIATALTAGAATLLLTPQNLRRVTASTVVMLLGAAVGWVLGDPLSQGSYDHLGGEETAIGWLTGGTIGAIVGWALTVVWQHAHDSRPIDNSEKFPGSHEPIPPERTP